MPDLKHLAQRFFRDTLAAVNVPATMQRKLARVGSHISIGDKRIDLAAYERICAVAFGKGSVAMARGLYEVLAPDFAFEGILVAPHDLLEHVPGFRAIGAGHPLPDEGSLKAGRAVLELLAGCDSRTLIFFPLSGGGSALVEWPLDSKITLAELRDLYRLLVTCGASIDEINAVRKHLSAVKGGRLAAAAPAAMKLSYGITDVPAGCESALGSGPTLPDPTTVADACRVIERFALAPKLPSTIREKFETPEGIPETPKAGDPAFALAHFELLLGSRDLFHHAHMAAEARGCVCMCDNTTDDWPLTAAVDYLLGQLERFSRSNPGRRVAIIGDGEVSSPVIGDGMGGRNSAFVLDCVEKIAGKKITVLSAGTDGRDGSSFAAGAVADGETLLRARRAGLDPRDFILRSDSYSFFRELGDAVETGPTGINLRDLRLLLTE
jgi:hydroxypyruvate reductase